MLFLPYLFELRRHFRREGDREGNSDTCHTPGILSAEANLEKAGERATPAMIVAPKRFLTAAAFGLAGCY